MKRTGVIHTAKKLRLKQSAAPGFFGKLKKRNPLGWWGVILELIGKPLYWAILLGGIVVKGTLLVTSKLAFLVGKVTLSIGELSFQIALFLVRNSITTIIIITKTTGWVLTSFSRLIYRYLKTIVTHLGRIRIRIKFTLPKIKPKPIWLLPPLGLILIMTLTFTFYFSILKDLPNPNYLITREQAISTKIYDRQGRLLYKIYRTQNRTLVPLTEIPMSVIQATIAIEDSEFYRHRGFSTKAIIRAFFQNLQGGKLYGGSTITQQLVKNALLTPERTMKRKAKEVLLALWAEQKFTKDEILQMYLNEVGYGGAAYGIEEAAQMYFGKSVRDLNLAEAALLAGLPAAPTTYSPFGSHPERAKERQTLVLKRMTEEDLITQEEAEKAKEQELHFAPQRTDIQAPHFVMHVKDLLAEKYGLRMVEEGGLEVITSLDLDIQNQAQTAVSQEIEKLRPLHITNGAALVTNPTTGEILAMVGSKNYFDIENDGNVNVTLRPRQPGSAIKPVNYSIALENGFTPATIIPDTPITYHLPGQPPYSPRNYDGQFHGNVPLRIALASSYNVPAVKVLSALGVDRMIKRGQEMGITTWDNPSRFGLSLTLGGGEVKMIDMAVVYGTLANLGTRVDLNPILAVKDHRGKNLEKSEAPNSHPGVLDAKVAYILTDILSDNNARAAAFGPSSILNIPQHPHVAVKTGTTQNMRDNWTIGYTPDYLVAIWVGNNNNTPMSYVASGITGASPIWNKIMSFLLTNIPDKEFSQPEDLIRVEICPLTNTLPCQGCGGKWEYFLPGAEPKRHCDPEQLKTKPTPSVD